MAIGATIPFVSHSLRKAPWSDSWDELSAGIAGNPVAWRWANGLFLAAAVVTGLGFAALSARFHGRARSLALMGLVAFGLAAVLSLVDRIIAMAVATWAALQGLGSDDLTVQAFIRMDEGFNMGFFVLGFLSVVLFGLAMTRSEVSGTVGRWLVGAGVVGLVVAIVGFAIPAFVYLATGAIGVLALGGRLPALP